MSDTKAVYAASLDPITNGHLWVISQGVKLFTSLTVAVAMNPAKSGRYFFNESERVALAGMCVPNHVPVVAIGPMYLVDFAQQENANYLIRGARNAEDFAVEATMAEINRKMAAQRGFTLETIILTPPQNLAIVSSSFVKSLIGYSGWQKEIKQYVPEEVASALISRGKQ